MYLPSEIEARYAIPALRAFIVRKLVREHGFTQEAAAKSLGLTQAAVSNYLRGVRGVMSVWETNKQIQEYVNQIVSRIVADSINVRTVLKMMNQTLLEIRRRKLLCIIHREVEPQLNPSECDIC